MLYFDIGANVGNWSLANIREDTTIIAVEAQRSFSYENLIKNVSMHKNIIPLNYAVHNTKDEYIKFYECSDYGYVLSTTNKEWFVNKNFRFYGSNYTEVLCKTITIDNLILKYGIPNIVKIDVEGAEYEALTSLTHKVDNICFEWASEVKDVTLNCLDYLFKIGFTKFCIQQNDNYTFRPTEYEDISVIKTILSKQTPKVEWGMIWAQ